MRCILSFNFDSGALYLRFEKCYEGKIRHVCSYSRHKHKLFILLHLSDFMTCSERFNIQREGSIISALEQYRKMKFRTNLHLTLISDFVVLNDFKL